MNYSRGIMMNDAVKDKKQLCFRIIVGLVVIVWSFFILDRGFYADESGLLSTYKFLYNGERLFVDIWEELQTGGILTYPLFALYYNVLELVIYPLGIGVVLYMRICYNILRLLIAIYLYLTIRRTDYRSGAFVAALAYYVFFDSFKNISYKSMCDFGVMLFFCWGIRYLQSRNVFYFVLMGLATCFSIVAYPTMIILPFFFVIFLIVLERRCEESLLKPIIIYSITCFIAGGLVLLFLQLTVGIQNIIPQLAYIEDNVYDAPIYVRMGKMILSYCFFLVIAYIPIGLRHLIGIWKEIEDKYFQILLSLYWIIFMIAIIVARIDSVSTTRLIYGLLIIFFWYPYLVNKEEKTEYTQIGKYKQAGYGSKNALNSIFMFSVIVQLIWALSTNQEVAIPGHMCIYVIIALFAIADSFEGLKLLKIAVVIFLLYFMGVWVAEDDGGYSDIFEHRIYVDYGAYRGIAMSDEDYEMNEACYNLTSQYITSEDYLYVPIGYSVTAYLNSDARQAAGSPYAHAGVGQNRVMEYWEINPDNKPDFILLNTANKYYGEFEAGETYKYVLENYKTTVATQGDFILLAR